jgi:hypothetical protein
MAKKPKATFKDEEPIEAVKKYKLDLFKDVMPAINRKDFDFYDKCTEEERASIFPPVLLRWLTTVNKGFNVEHSSETQNSIVFINEMINKIGLFNIPSSKDRDHKKLQWLMLCVAGTGNSRTMHGWVPVAGTSSTPLIDALIKIHNPLIGKQEMDTFKMIITQERLVELCKDTGMDDKEIKKHTEELKKIR